MADELNFRITATDEATPVMDKVQAEKAKLETPVAIPITAPAGLVDAEFTMKSMALQMEQLQGGGAGAGAGLRTIGEEGAKAAESVNKVGTSATAASLPLYRLAQLGAGTGVALGGITDRGLAAAASLALMGGPVAGIAAGIGATIIGLNALSDALGQTQKASSDQQKLIAAIGVDGAQSIALFGDRIQDLQNDVTSLGNLFTNAARGLSNLVTPGRLDDLAAARKGLQEFEDVLKDAPGTALILAETLNSAAAAGTLTGNAAQLNAEQMAKMNDEMVALIQASGTEAVNQQVLKDAIGAVTAARLLGLDIQQRQGEQVQDYITRIETEVAALDHITQVTADAAAASAAADAIRQTAAATYDVVTAAELRGIDSKGQTVQALGEEIAAWQGVTAAMEAAVDATVAKKQADEANAALATARLEAAQLGVQVSGLGADATNRAIIAAGELNAVGKDTVESAALQAAAKKKLADAENLWTKAVELGLDPARIAADQLSATVADAEANAKATADMATAQGNLARVFDASGTGASAYALAVGEAAAASAKASKEQQLVNRALEDGIDPMTQNADATQLLIDQHDELVKSNDKLVSSLDELDTKWVAVRDDVGGVEDDADAFTKAWAKATEQVFGLADTFDNVTTAAARLKKEEADHGATLEANTVEGSKQLTLIEATRKAIGTDLAEAYRNSGGDLQKLRDRGDFWSVWLDKNLPKDLDTATKGMQGWRTVLGNIPELIQTTLDIAVQEENLRKLEQVKEVIDLLPPELQTRVKVQMTQDATKAVQFFDFLAKAERVKHDLPVNVQLEMDKLLIAGDVVGIQKLLADQGFKVELPTFLTDPAPLDPAKVEATTGQEPAAVPTALTPPDPLTPEQRAAVAAQETRITIPTSADDPTPLTPEQKAVAAQESSFAIPVSLQVDQIGDFTRGIGTALELPPGVDLTDPTKGLTVGITPVVVDEKLQAAIVAMNAATVDPNTGEARQAVINVETSGAADAQNQINAVASNNGKGYTATVHVQTDVPVPKGTTTIINEVPTKPDGRSAPSVVINQRITAGIGTDRLSLDRALRKANHRIERLAGIRA